MAHLGADVLTAGEGSPAGVATRESTNRVGLPGAHSLAVLLATEAFCATTKRKATFLVMSKEVVPVQNSRVLNITGMPKIKTIHHGCLILSLYDLYEPCSKSFTSKSS